MSTNLYYILASMYLAAASSTWSVSRNQRDLRSWSALDSLPPPSTGQRTKTLQKHAHAIYRDF